jgi:AraC family transcriptional regulator
LLCANEDVFAGGRRVVTALPGLTVEYSWLPPFHGASLTRPNRLEVVFSAHDSVAVEQERVVHEVRANPGGCFVVGAQPPTLLCVPEYSDTLEMYPDMSLLRAAAAAANIRHFELEPSVRAGRATTHRRDPIVLGVAHVLRRASLGTTTISDVSASQAAHLLVARVLENQHGIRPCAARPLRLGSRALATLAEHIEASLEQTITIDELARLSGMSPFHFARCFKLSTGLAPHQYVLARRIDRAKRLLLTTSLAVQDIAWKIGFENINHFRRQFRVQFGVSPGELRAAIRARPGDWARS